MKNIFILIILMSLISCGSKWDGDLLKGKWTTIEWKVKNAEKRINAQMDFKFGDDGRYSLDYGSKIEQGKYWIYGDFLHTVEDGMKEKKVKILDLSSENFSFEMNRSGSLERVVLKKVN